MNKFTKPTKVFVLEKVGQMKLKIFLDVFFRKFFNKPIKASDRQEVERRRMSVLKTNRAVFDLVSNYSVANCSVGNIF